MNKAFACMTRLLARREHGERELIDKLLQKGYAQSDICDALEECKRLGLQSDARFADSVCRTRIHQGYGPIKIRQELQAKQVDRELIDHVLRQEQDNWLAHAAAIWEKKYKYQGERSLMARQKQQRFLLYRGFPMDIVTLVLNDK